MEAITGQAVHLAEDRFADNLALAFVGGSYARGTHQATSDIDAFVLLHHSDRAAERAFAKNLRDLHHRAGLDFDHCGEIFDAATLEALLAFTEQVLAAAPALQHSACYQADCPLSVFRKGDVVFKFLADPKIHIRDPHHLLPDLEDRATAYFTRWPMPRVQEHKKHLHLPPGSPQSRLAAQWAAHAAGRDWTDTPVGIGLERWFGATPLRARARRFPPLPAAAAPHSPRACPLPDAQGPARQAFAAQCLAFTHPAHPEGS
ncbi:nucleotidyltransferase domain-containing protein [Streptomyces sp. B1866]|uniref:nucleotidyltransferase domain-containing protein n=1 Tax=Streptomyces sp. B1866 TaxID=3075431 RepID=UPI00288E7355|nr:nucleotidyltransferase domain-containing protein [Streptomyces sp. B1866]MDT3399833.1 nucleotidyltransferase domain-containing protein [Streptomyces sp. B1866]